MGRRSYSGNAVPTVLSGGIGALDLTFTVQDATGYPTGAAGPFYVTLARGAAGEEKVLCDSRSGTTFTVNATGRGADGTIATSHAASSTTVEHTITKTDVDEANAHVNDTTGDPHPQYLTPAEGNAAYVTRAEALAASVAAQESTTSTTFADLATVGPQVTVTVGASGRLLVVLSAVTFNGTADAATVASIALSGANTVAAIDGNGFIRRQGTASLSDGRAGHTVLTGLSPGSTTVTMKYRASAGTASFLDRRLVAIPL